MCGGRVGRGAWSAARGRTRVLAVFGVSFGSSTTTCASARVVAEKEHLRLETLTKKTRKGRRDLGNFDVSRRVEWQHPVPQRSNRVASGPSRACVQSKGSAVPPWLFLAKAAALVLALRPALSPP